MKNPENLGLMLKRNLTKVLPKLTTILKIGVTLLILSREDERKFSKLSKVKTH